MFTKKLTECAPHIRESKRKVDGVQTRCWVGAAIRGTRGTQIGEIPTNDNLLEEKANYNLITKRENASPTSLGWLENKVRAVGKRVQDAIRRVWPARTDNSRDWTFVVWLLQKQLDDIQESGYTGLAMVKELAGMEIVITRFFLAHGFGPVLKFAHKGYN